MSSELLAILLLAVVHVPAACLLLGMALREEGLRGWWPREGSDDGDSGPGDRPRGGGPPLADAEPAKLRLRGPGKLADAHRGRRGRTVEPTPPQVPARDADARRSREIVS